MPAIRVSPAALSQAASEMSAAAGEISALRGRLLGAGGAATACGPGPAGAAYDHMCRTWLVALGDLHDTVASMGEATSWACVDYQATDISVIPPPPGP